VRRIVDLLEVVHVDEQARQGATAALGLTHLLHQALVEETTVVDAGEDVGEPHPFETFVVGDVLQADGGEQGQAFQEVGAGAGQVAGALGAAEIEAADDLAAPHQGQEGDAGGGLGAGEQGAVTIRLVGPQVNRGPWRSAW